MSSEEAIIEMDIVLSARASGQIREILEEVKKKKKETKQEAEEPQEIAKDLLEEEKEEKISELMESFKDVNKGQIQQFGQLAKNPTSFITNSLTKLLGSGSMAILGPLALAVASPIVLAEILKALSVKGGPFNRDWRRFISKEFDVGLSREQQKLKELGFDQVILTQVQGMKSNNTGWTYNSLFDINEMRLARIGLSDRTAGVTAFG